MIAGIMGIFLLLTEVLSLPQQIFAMPGSIQTQDQNQETVTGETDQINAEDLSNSVKVEQITFADPSPVIGVGKTYTLKPTIEPADSSNQNLAYTSSDNTVATVDATGKVIGWKEGSAVIIAQSLDGSNVTASVEVEVTYLNTYDIQFKGNGSTSGSTAKMKGLSYQKSYALSANGFKRKGYTFQGWNTKADGSGVSYGNKELVEKLTKTQNGIIVLYAQWKKTKYSIKYNLRGGTQNSKNPAKYYITTKTIKLLAPSRKGYLFLGWYKNKEGTGSKVEQIKKGSTGNRILYAKWSKKKYTITYVLSGGTQNKENPSSYTITSKTITLKAPAKAGYTFKGWYSDSKFKNKVVTIAAGSTGNRKLYAKWSINSYQIVFKGNGALAGSVDPIKGIFGRNYTLNLNNFIRKGYNFAGWNTKKDGSGTAYVDRAAVKDLSNTNGAKVVLYAQWTKMDTNCSAMANEVVSYVNTCRKQLGYGELSADKKLMALAQERARESAAYWSHMRPDGSSCFTLYDATNYSYGAAGENIAYGYTTSKSVMEGWLNSQGHRENILSTSYTKIGVGVYYANGVYYWVQNFSN